MDEREEPAGATAAPAVRMRPGGLRHAGQAGEGVERRLAALAFLDVAGYSRLMGSNEAATLRRWLSLRGGVVEPRVAGWRGRVVSRTGDGLFVEFRSVLDAIGWAFDVQAALAAAPAAVAEAPPLLVRVAVHLGDVIGAADGGVYGDAVNVAARLQEHAAPGGVVVSAAVHEQVRHLLAYEAEDLGPLALKNIGRPVHGFRVGPAVPRHRGSLPVAGVHAAFALAAPVATTSPAAAPTALVARLVAAEAHGARAARTAASGSASALVSKAAPLGAPCARSGTAAFRLLARPADPLRADEGAASGGEEGMAGFGSHTAAAAARGTAGRTAAQATASGTGR